MPDQSLPDDFDGDDPGHCERCYNTGEVDCYCGGDLCACGREIYPCPRCKAALDPDRLREDRDERNRLAREFPDNE